MADYTKCGISYGIAGIVSNPQSLQSLTPYLWVLFFFIGFVGWNGGVVLGMYHFLSFLYQANEDPKETKKTTSSPFT